MHGPEDTRSHMPLFVKKSTRPGHLNVQVSDQDGCQARVFYNPTRPKSEPKSVIMNVIEIEMTLDTAMDTFNFKL